MNENVSTEQTLVCISDKAVNPQTKVTLVKLYVYITAKNTILIMNSD